MWVGAVYICGLAPALTSLSPVRGVGLRAVVQVYCSIRFKSEEQPGQRLLPTQLSHTSMAGPAGWPA